MSLLDYLRQEYLSGKVLDKYRLENGHIAAVLEDESTHRRYHVEFGDSYGRPCAANLYGLLEPFAGKSQHLERLIQEGDHIALTVNYSKSPIRNAYYVHSVSRSAPIRTFHERSPKLVEMSYMAGKGHQYRSGQQ